MRYEVEVNGRRRLVTVHRLDGHFGVQVDDRAWIVDAARIDGQTLSLLMAPGDGRASSRVSGGQSHEVILAPNTGAGTVMAHVDGVPAAVTPNGRRRGTRSDDGGLTSGPQRLVAPMPGKVVRVLVKPGDTVRARQSIVVVEAMKMENELRAVRDGRVIDVAARDGQSVEAGVLLVVIADS